MPSYPSTPVAFPTRLPGTPCDPSHWNLMADEIGALDAALMAPSSELVAPMRPRGLGAAVEWGHGTTGRMCVLGAGYGRCGVIYLMAEPGSTPATLKTRGNPGAALTLDIGGNLYIALAPAASADNQTPQLGVVVYKTGAVYLPSHHRMMLRKGDGQSIPTGAWTDLTWDVEVLDPGWHAAGAAAFTIPSTAIYLVNGQLTYATQGTATNQGMAFNKVSGAAPTGRLLTVLMPPATGLGTGGTQSLNGMVLLTAGDVCSFQAWHNDGAGSTIINYSAGNLTRLWTP